MVGSSHLIEALTVPTAAYSFNYEKLEVIGDTFLKFLATAYVFAENIESQERLLHYARREIIMIRTLLKHCMDHKLDDFITTIIRVPPNFLNPSGGRATTHTIPGPRGKGYFPTSCHARSPVQQKTLADVAESEMDAGLMIDGLSGTLPVSRCLEFGHQAFTPRPDSSTFTQRDC
ncbi:hypothetical protein CF328_g3596 [Tilletia controversa]|nr:hypothetical protein CF328_g3596 [Tilletia controversa]